MPKYEDYSDEQEWDVVSWNKIPQDKQQNEKYIETIPFNKMLILARQKAQYTANKLAQALHIKIKDYELFENGTKLPDKNILYKINKFLNSKLTIN
tara:strand:- start:108 stop:395 length:288 start_codon:yes stop_codon:yes gene_type:complete